MKKRILSCLLVFAMSISLFACGSKDEPKTEKSEAVQEAEVEEPEEPEAVGIEKYADSIDRIELFGIEDGVIYWDVYFKDGVKWSSTYESADLAREAIKECYQREENGDNLLYVTGWEHNNNIAFSWQYADSTNLKIFQDNVFYMDYGLRAEEVSEMLGE